jgi:hypothetical protein
MGFLNGAKRTKTRYLIEVPHDPDECTQIMDEIIGRGPQYAQLFWWGCHVGEHRAWAWLDGSGREEVLEEALPPVLRARAVVHRVSRVDGPELRDWHEAQDAARR